MSTHRAAWIFPVDGPPLRDGVLTVADGRIAAVEPSRGQDVAHDHGDAAILPGLVNAHVHLDLGALRGKLPPPAHFTAWLKEVIAYRRSSPPEEWDAAITAGIDECLSSGTTLVGDIAANGRSFAPLRNSPLRGVVFYELIGLKRERAEQTWAAAMEWMADCPPRPGAERQGDKETRRQGEGEIPSTSAWGLGDASSPCLLVSLSPCLRLGLSPHAPYTVGAWLLEQAVAYACQFHLPLAMHLGETADEWELLEQHRGPLRDFLESLGVWDEASLAPSMAMLLRTLGVPQPSLLAHGNYFTARERPQIGSSVVYCPRTHAYFGHPPHPFRELLQAGVNVALGTDSLASNPDLSLWEELRFLARRHPDLSVETLLRMGTLNGATALGFEGVCGSLVPGKAADFIVVQAPTRTGTDGHRFLFAEGSVVREVYVNGCLVSPP